MLTLRFVDVEGAAMFRREIKRKVAAMIIIKNTNCTKILISLDCHGTY